MICFQGTKVQSLHEVIGLTKKKIKGELSWKMFCLPLLCSVNCHTAETKLCVCVCVRDVFESSVFTHLLPVVVSFLFGLPPPTLHTQTQSFSGQISGRLCEINLRENKQRSTTTNTVNCLSGSLAGAAR